MLLLVVIDHDAVDEVSSMYPSAAIRFRCIDESLRYEPVLVKERGVFR